ncbi:MAG: hypothetical protein QM778_39145 [Myxococcales bacterium]
MLLACDSGDAGRDRGGDKQDGAVDGRDGADGGDHPDDSLGADAGEGTDAGDGNDASSTLDPDLQRWLLDGPASPLDLSVVVDSARGIDAVVGVEGGSFSVTAEDGTSFELTIPPNAVFNDTPIQMAPVSAIGGLPSELSEAHAVHLGPEGLTFNELVELRIVTATPPPISEAVPFGFHAEGEGMFLTHRGASSDHPIVLLDHFSGYGVARGSILDTPEFVQRMGDRRADRFRSRMAWERMRANRHLPADPTIFPMPSEIDPFYEFYRDRVIYGHLGIGVSMCDAALATLAEMTGFVHDRYLVGVAEGPDGPYADLKPMHPYVADVSRRCLMEEYDLCTGPEPRVFHRLLPVWRSLRHQALLYGMDADEALLLKQLDAYAEDLADKCLQFHLDFVSVVDLTPEGGSYHVAVESRVIVRLKPENIVSGKHMLQGTDNMVTTQFVFLTDGCTVTSDGGPDVPFDVDDLIFQVSPHVLWQERGRLEGVTLRYFPGVTQQKYKVVCPDAGTFESPAEPLWTAGYVDAHQLEIRDDSAFETIDWTLNSSNPRATKYWNATGSDPDLHEVGHFELSHQPGG